MILKTLMLLLKPTDTALESSERSTTMQYRITCYHYLLERLMKRYAQYAISDTVIASYGHFKIVHELRDFEFESEVRRNGMSITLTSASGALPVRCRKAQGTKYWSYFDFKDTLHVVTPQGDILVEHSTSFSVIGNAEATIEGPSSDDILLVNRINMQKKVAQSEPLLEDEEQVRPQLESAAPAAESRGADNVWYTTVK